jgi:hypothetical protein
MKLFADMPVLAFLIVAILTGGLIVSFWLFPSGKAHEC